MAKPKSKSDNVSHLPATTELPAIQITADATRFALSLGVQLSGTLAERSDAAAEYMSRSQRYMLAAGVLLMSVKAEAEHGQFLELIQERGFELRTAQRSMQYAQFVLSRPEEEREQLIGMKQSKVLALAGADPEVIEAMLADGAGSIDALTVSQLRERLRETEASLTDTQVQLETADTKVRGLEKRLKRVPGEREDKVPLVVADLRAEIMALGKKAALALDSFNPLGVDVVNLMGGDETHGWADATLRLALSQLITLRLQIDGLVTKFLREVPGGDPTPVKASYLTKDEVLESARRFNELTQVHNYEAALREWERAQGRPRGKGRPAEKPVAPGGAA